MTDSYLDDALVRIGRDPLCKRELSDRIFGALRLTIIYGIEPVSTARGALAGIDYVLNMPDELEVPDKLRFSTS